MVPGWQEVVNLMATALVWLYDMLSTVGLPSWGLVIIVFTLIIKIVLLPLTVQQLKSTRVMQTIQPAIKDLQKKYGKDREKLAAEQMKLYKELGYNPMSGCLPMIIQFPIWIALYGALLTLANPPADSAFAGIQLGGFLWVENLAVPGDNWYILAVLSGIFQWVATRMMTPKTDDPQQQSINRTTQFMPFMFVFFGATISSGLVLYWVANAFFSIITQYPFTGWGSLEGFDFFGLWKREPAPVGKPGKAGKSAAVKAIIEPSSNGEEKEEGVSVGDGATGEAQRTEGSRRRRSRRR